MKQSSAKSVIIILLLVAALFLAMNRIVQDAPAGDWWLVVALILLALLVGASDWWGKRYPAATDAAQTPASASAQRVYEAPAPTAETAKRAYTPTPLTELEADYDRMRDREASADAMASATHLQTDEALENEGMVENVMTAGATGEHHEVDEIAGGPTKSLSKTQEMRAVSLQVPTEPDDLTLIEGIGPKMAAALNAAGISTFTQLESATIPQLEAAIQAAGMRFAPSMPTWAEQAAFAARGDKKGLTALQKKLKGGRKK